MSQQFVCLSGLPRSGSTMLSSILNQNPLIYSEGNSAVCQLLWDMYLSATKYASEQLGANNRHDTPYDLVSHIPKVYYKNVPKTKEVIIDKCRSWTMSYNVDLLLKYVDPNIKIIVLERSITDIFKSFMKLYKKNNINDEQVHVRLSNMLVPNSEPILRSAVGVNMARKKNEENPSSNKNFLFIKYDDLIKNTQEIMNQIYDFCGWAPYTHDFNNIVNQFPENDAFYGLKGFHEIRQTISKEENEFVLPPDILEKCQKIDKTMGYIN